MRNASESKLVKQEAQWCFPILIRIVFAALEHSHVRKWLDLGRDWSRSCRRRMLLNFRKSNLLNTTRPGRELETKLFGRLSGRWARFRGRGFLTRVGRLGPLGGRLQFESGRQERGHIFGLDVLEQGGYFVAEIRLFCRRTLESRRQERVDAVERQGWHHLQTFWKTIR